MNEAPLLLGRFVRLGFLALLASLAVQFELVSLCSLCSPWFKV